MYAAPGHVPNVIRDRDNGIMRLEGNPFDNMRIALEIARRSPDDGVDASFVRVDESQ